MTAFVYCPQCWPYDLGEYNDAGRCSDCGNMVIVATPEKQIDLLLEQNEALSLSLKQAMEALSVMHQQRLHPQALRLVRSRRTPDAES